MKDLYASILAFLKTSPRIRALVTAGLASTGTWAITKLGLHLTEDQRPQIIIYAGLATAWIFRDRDAKVADTGIKAFQAEMPVKVLMPDGSTERQAIDGVVGEVTIANAKQLAVESPRPVPVTAATVNLT